MSLTFSQIQHAWQVQDPALVEKLYALATQPDPTPERPIADDDLTFERFLHKIFSPSFRAQPDEVQFAERVAMIAKLEADEGAYPLPDRFKIHLILTALWHDGSDYARGILKQAINKLPLTYGVWKGLKYIYKAAEYVQDFEIFAHITAKIDLYRFDKSQRTPVSLPTKTYMSLRAWRYLRTLGQQMPTAYIEAAVWVLASYDEAMTVDSPQRAQSWVLNHICFHNTLDYGVDRFSNRSKRKLFDAKGRAFADIWQRDPKPLITLLASAKNEAIRQFATDSLKHDFKTTLRDVEVETIRYLSSGFAHSNARDEMIVWLLEQSPNFEKAKFVDLGLHDVVLKLLYSNYAEAYNYAISYAKSYAQDIATSELMFLAISEHKAVRQFAIEQILSRDPVKDIGLVGWGQLLDSQYHHEIASKQLAKHFSAKELTPEWFFARLTSGNDYSVDFAIEQLPKLYSAKELGHDYFIRLAYRLGGNVPHNNSHNDYHDFSNGYELFGSGDSVESAMQFALQELKRLDLSQVEAAAWQYLLLHPLAQDTIIDWIDEELITANKLPMSYWHALAYEPDWHTSEYINQLTHAHINRNSIDDIDNEDSSSDAEDAAIKSGDIADDNATWVASWQRHLKFDDYLADTVRTWLADVRRFNPTELGFDWLITLAQSDQASYREFAINRINKGFLPADFANFSIQNNGKDGTDADKDDKPADQIADGDKKGKTKVTVDLQQQRFLFTGKMQSMTRGEAEKLVKDANGEISSAVNGKLDYLVIGDEGSPLYGNGRKGSKQVKAESLIAGGASLKIISETAFLQMLTGQTREVSEDETLAGAQALWHMATDDPTAPISELALSYLTHHHEQICMALTDRPVDPEAIIPNEFFDAQRIMPLLSHGNSRLRKFALLVAEYEMANWKPSPTLWVQAAESPYSEVSELLERALLAEPSAENRRYHVSSEQYNADMLNALVASRQRFARHIGITLLQRHPKFQNVEMLYRLSQSTEREIRYAAVSMLWQRYKARHLSPNWTPHSADNGNENSRDNSRGIGNDNVAGNKAMSKNDDKSNLATHVANANTRSTHSPDALLEEVPASIEQLLMLLRRGLYEVPPGRLGGAKDNSSNSNNTNNASNTNQKSGKQSKYAHHQDKSKAADHAGSSLKMISTSKAKLALIETFRDVGLADKSFAAAILPVLYAFTHSAGKMERNACLVAITRLLNRYPDLASHLNPQATA